MSESSQEAAGSGEQQWPSKEPSGSKSRPILFGLLAVMLLALGYDYLVARPAVREAYDKIAEASVDMNARGASADSGEVDYLSNEDVQEMLGKTPSETFEDGKYHVEVFNFMGGTIIKPHKLYTVYRKSGDGWMFSRHSSFIYEARNDIGRDGGVIDVPAGTETMSDDEYAAASGDPNAAASVREQQAEEENEAEADDAGGDEDSAEEPKPEE